MLNSANHEAGRDRFLPVTAGAHLGGINAATMGLTGSASDYMRLAMPVRDPDNGDNSISGSGKYFYSFINIKIFHSKLAMHSGHIGVQIMQLRELRILNAFLTTVL